MFIRMCVALCCTVTAATVEGQRPAPKRECSVQQIDSTRVGPEVYRDCEVDKPAKLRRDESIRFEFPQGMTCATVNLEFVVDSAGKPVTETVALVATNSREFAVRVIQSLPRWQYEPAQLDGRRVSQIIALRHVMQEKRLPFSVAGQPAPPPPRQPPCK